MKAEILGLEHKTKIPQKAICVPNLDIHMSTLDIRKSKVILEFGKNETAKNSRLNVAFRMFISEF